MNCLAQYLVLLSVLYISLGGVLPARPAGDATRDSIGEPSAHALPEPLLDSGSLEHEGIGHRLFDSLHLNGLAPSHESQLLGAQTEVMYMQERQETLNRRLRSGQFTDDFLYEYASKSSEQTNTVLNSTKFAMTPYALSLQRSIANFLVASYLNSVTTGANMYNGYLGDHQKSITTENIVAIRNMTSAYDSLVSLSRFASLDAALLQSTSQHILGLLRL